MSFKTLYQFPVNIDQEVEEVTTKSENGQEITIKTKVKKSVPVKILMKELTRREKQDLNVWYAKNYNEAINVHGLSPRVFIVQKFLRDPNNPLSEDQDRNLAKMYEDLEAAKNDYVRVSALKDDEYSQDRKQRIVQNFITLQRKVMDIETAYKSIFAHTAENFAQNKAITWLVLFLSYSQKGEAAPEPLFLGKDFAEKEDRLFNLEDSSDPLYMAAVEKLSTFWGLYYFGQASTKEDFDKVEADFAKQLEDERKADEEAKREQENTAKAASVPAETADPAPSSDAQDKSAVIP